MPKKYLSRDILILSILTVITVFTWIGLEVYEIMAKTEIPAVLKHQIEPLNPTIEKEIFQNLKSRKSFSTEELIVPPATVEVSIEEEVPIAESEIEEATPGAEATPRAQ